MANINEFKSRLKGGGARANQFKVTMSFPGYAEVGAHEPLINAGPRCQPAIWQGPVKADAGSQKHTNDQKSNFR